MTALRARADERCLVEIDLAAVRANARRLVSVLGRAELWAVLKADGYGHGAAACAEAALEGGARRLCCATLGEARELREALGPAVPVIVLSPLQPGEEPHASGFEVCVSTPDAAGRLAASGADCPVHVKADTGMGRWGLPPADALELGRALAAGSAGGLRLAGLMSHLATADQPDGAFRDVQARRFAELAAVFPPAPRHLANSAAALRAPHARWDAARCGIALYGVSPSDDDPRAEGLAPALRWTSYVAAVRSLAPGESSGYGRRLVADRPLRLALVPVGYADGYPRALSGVGDVLVRGRRRRVAATVSMDQLTAVVDDDVEPGDQVVLLGEQGRERVGAEELARRSGTIGYEICCGVVPGRGRGARRWLRGGDHSDG
jgi:alanine racemase